MAKNELEFNQETYLRLLKQFLDNAQEERDLALDRYRRQDDQMQTMDEFVLMGKNAAEFLKIASNRSEALFNATKELKTLIFKEETKSGAEGMPINNQDIRRQMIQEIRKMNEENPDFDMNNDEENKE